MKGFSIGIDSISGIPLDELGQRQPVSQQPNYPLPQGRAGQFAQAVVGFDRGDVCGQAVTETVRVVQIAAHTGLVDGLGEHPIDVEVDAFGLGEFQNLALDIGQLRRGQIVEIDISDVGSLQISQVVGNVDFVFHQRLKRHDLEGALMRGGQYHRGGATVV